MSNFFDHIDKIHTNQCSYAYFTGSCINSGYLPPGTVVGVGVGLTRDCSTLMVAQYFKRRRELVEIFIVSGSGLGIAVMSTFIKGAIK